MNILVSACLLDYRIRYDGTSKTSDFIMSLKDQHELIIVCPEIFGGLDIPHSKIELKDGVPYTEEGMDVSENFEKGTKISCNRYNVFDCSCAILKSKSPSCGSGKIYNGNFDGTLIDGDGYLAKKLKANGIKVFTENDIEDIKAFIEKSK